MTAETYDMVRRCDRLREALGRLQKAIGKRKRVDFVAKSFHSGEYVFSDVPLLAAHCEVWVHKPEDAWNCGTSSPLLVCAWTDAVNRIEELADAISSI